MSSKPLALFLQGLNDRRQLQAIEIKPNGGLHYQIDGSSNLFQSIHSERFDKRQQLLDPHQPNLIQLSGRPSVIFNEIADPDSHALTLARAEKIISKLGDGVQVLNHPAKILNTRRESVAKRLQGIPGLLVPKTIRFQPLSPAGILAAIEAAELHFPVIMRPVGAHTGSGTYRFEGAEQVLTHYAQALDGRAYYLTQFVDYAQQGVYRKHRLILIEDVVILRHVRYADHWMIHRKNNQDYVDRHPECLQREQGLIASFEQELLPRIRAPLAAIKAVLGLDYFGIDCAIDDQARLLIFEANACMNVTHFRDKGLYEPIVDSIKAAVTRMIEVRCQSRF